MMSHYLSAEGISLDLVTQGKRSALSKIALRIAQNSGLDDQVVLRGLLDREDVGSTGVGRGIAIPHALLDMSFYPVASLTRLAPSIYFDGPDDEPVDLLYTLLWPRSSIATFLPALSQMCRLLWLPQMREKLRRAESADEVMVILNADMHQTFSSKRALVLESYVDGRRTPHDARTSSRS